MATPGFHAQLACLWEVTARKAGNVTRFHDFPDLNYMDFVLSAAAIAPVLDQASRQPLGQTILNAIQATRSVVSTNTNLGLVLLLAPISAVPEDRHLQSGIAEVLQRTDNQDADQVYQAIRLAVPGGMERVEKEDIRNRPTGSLLDVMALAQERDRIAQQYCSNFKLIFELVVGELEKGIETTGTLEQAIIWAQLQILSQIPDSLIQRKMGLGEAKRVSQMAAEVLHAGWPRQKEGRLAFVEFDHHLRSRGNKRNPGTTADLVGAGLFVLLREGKLKIPSSLPWSNGYENE